MSRINTNVQSLIAQRVLGQNNQALSVSLERLSTGLRINRGADDPAGLIASENLRSEKVAIGQAINNSERAAQVVAIAEGGLTEIAGLLNELEGLVTATANDAGLSSEEKAANQLQVDSILQTIDRVASATSFQGNRLLNGNLDYTASNVSNNVGDYQINGAKLQYGGSLDVDVVITQSAQVGGFFLSFGGTSIDLGTGSSFVFEISGVIGNRELSFASGTALADIVDAINTFTEVTGVEASVSATGIRLESSEFGSDQFVSVKIIDDGNVNGADGIYNYVSDDTNTSLTSGVTAFNTQAAANGLTDAGQDVGATINGITATSRGAKASINTDFLSVDLTLEATGSGAHAQSLGSVSALTITGGGADFQLASNVDIAGKVSLGIGNVAARTIGRSLHDLSSVSTEVFLADLANGADLNLETGDLVGAQKVVSQAIKDVSSLRGRLGAFQKNTVGATIRSLGVSLENTTAAESAIRDSDFASETSELTRAQILVSSTTNVLAIANSQPQNVLSLLG
ncbi:MAG: flagellin [Phycisphaeraceae bacterium]|nr:flagellin [Phycisphaeraceae bacterium]MCB9847987.1 flagellin [Phycisphaeraceae bacterium]